MRQRPDFPFYNGQPTIGPLGWLIVVAAAVLGFVLLTTPQLQFAQFPISLIPAALFVALPLVGLRLAAGSHWTAIFHTYGPAQWAISFGFAILTILMSFVAGFVASRLVHVAANPSVGVIAAAGPTAFVEFLVRTFIQLIGEELVTILPLLAVLWLCTAVLKLPRAAGIIIAVIVSTLWFSAMHLPTYNWNFLQCIIIIGTARLVLTTSYLVTRNIWVSIGAHILNDWSIFVLSFVGSHVPIGT